MTRRKRPRGPIQLAKLIGDIAIEVATTTARCVTGRELATA